MSSSPGLLTSFSDESDFWSNKAGNVSDDPNEKEKSRRFLNLDDIIGDLQRDEIHCTTRLPEDSPDALLDELIKLCSPHDSIKGIVWIQHPYKTNKLLLQGPGLGLIEKDIIQLVAAKFPKYNDIVVSEKEPQQCVNDGLPIYTRFLGRNTESRIPFFLKRQTCTDPKSDLWTSENRHASCGVFFDATSLSRSPQRPMRYALSAGHSLLSTKQCLRLVKGEKEEKSKVWREIVGDVKTRCRLTVAPHDHPPFEICEVPLINFRYYVPSVNNNLLWHEKFLADEALFEMNAEQLREQNWTGDRLQSYVVGNSICGGRQRRIDIAGVVRIKEPMEIGRLLNVKVMCGDVIGTIRPHPTSVYSKNETGCQFKIAHHIAFTCEQPLLPGQSGSPVFVYDTKEEVMYILAILMGAFDADERFGDEIIYQAILVYPALHRLEHFFPQHIKNIDLVGPNVIEQKPCKEVRKTLALVSETSRDSGIHNNSFSSSTSTPMSPNSQHPFPSSSSTPDNSLGAHASPNRISIPESDMESPGPGFPALSESKIQKLENSVAPNVKGAQKSQSFPQCSGQTKIPRPTIIPNLDTITPPVMRREGANSVPGISPITPGDTVSSNNGLNMRSNRGPQPLSGNSGSEQLLNFVADH